MPYICENNRSALVRNSFTFRASEQWNKLPIDLQVEIKIGQFKLKLKKWITEHVPRFLP